MPLDDAGDGGEEPRGERVGVHGERQGRARALLEPELMHRIVLDERELPRETHKSRARLGRADRLAADEEDATDLLLEGSHALADG